MEVKCNLMPSKGKVQLDAIYSLRDGNKRVQLNWQFCMHRTHLSPFIPFVLGVALLLKVEAAKKRPWKKK
jgi:hypothetical protein